MRGEDSLQVIFEQELAFRVLRDESLNKRPDHIFGS